MALSYSDLSEDLGKLIKHYNLQGTDATNLDADREEILDEFQDNSQDAAVDGLPGVVEGWKRQYIGRRTQLAQYASKRLTDRTSVVLEVAAPGETIGDVLPKLIDKMIVDSQTINASVVALGSTTAVGTATGSEKGTVLKTKILDGVNAPTQLGFAHRAYAGLNSELAKPSETMRLDCVADSFQSGATEGAETFSWIGADPDSGGQHGVQSEGSGNLGGVRAVHASVAQYLSNPDFETFSVANTPDSWTIVTGTAGTHIFQDTGAFYHGLSSLKYTGNGVLAAIELTQAPPISSLQANRLYVVTLRYKASATVGAGDLTVQFTGTGYTAGSTEKISIAHGSLATSWTLASFFVLMPSVIPSDFKLSIKWSGTPTNAKSLWIDDLGMAPVVYASGVGIAIVRGSNPFQVGDRYTFTVANSEGVIQKFFRRAYGVQLPSDNSAAETILDSVAT